jgi:hypothetical protein
MKYLIRWETPDDFHFNRVTRAELVKTIADILATPGATLWGIESDGE